MTGAGRTAVLVLAAWLLGAVALLAMQGMLVPYLAAGGLLTAAGAGVRAVVRQQRAPSMLDRPRVPERYRTADDLTQPIATVVAVAEREA